MPIRHVSLFIGHFQCPFSLDVWDRNICQFSHNWVYIHGLKFQSEVDRRSLLTL